MLNYTLKRLALSAPALVGVLVLVFLLIHLVPGDPVDQMLGEQASVADRNALRAQLGLDRPLGKQFADYARSVFALELGTSITSYEPVGSEIASRLPATFELTLAAMLLAALWGLPLGVWAAARPRHAVAWLAEALSLGGMSIPAVFLGPALIYVFAVRWDWLPISERGSWEHLVLPAISLALPLGAVILRMSRAAMLEVLSEDYIRTARAKGGGDGTVYFRHALSNAMIPIATVLTLQAGALLTGTVITETIFDWPGIGTLLFDAIQKRDYPLVQGCILVVGFIYLIVNLVGDLVYGWLNPRIRLENE